MTKETCKRVYWGLANSFRRLVYDHPSGDHDNRKTGMSHQLSPWVCLLFEVDGTLSNKHVANLPIMWHLAVPWMTWKVDVHVTLHTASSCFTQSTHVFTLRRDRFCKGRHGARLFHAEASQKSSSSAAQTIIPLSKWPTVWGHLAGNGSIL